MNPPDVTAGIVQGLLLNVLLPVWLLSGLADWLCHRVQRIEHSSGLKEALLHLLMLTEMGIGVCAALFLEINAAVLVLLIACCVAHELTTWWDLSYATSKRRIPVVEQWVHSFQMVLPWTGLISLMVLHHEQALALIGRGAQAPDWHWQLKDPSLPAGYIAAAFIASAVLVWLPFLQESWRCIRANR